MTLSSFLFGLGGRVNRAKWWAFLLASLVYFVAVEYVVVPLRVGFFVWLIALLPLAYMFFAVSIKRLHDRNKGAVWSLVLCGVPILVMCYRTYIRWIEIDANMALDQARTGEEMQAAAAAVQQAQQAMAAHLGSLGWVLFGIQVAFLAWALVELGFLKGTTGDNRYGADPLAAKPS